MRKLFLLLLMLGNLTGYAQKKESLEAFRTEVWKWNSRSEEWVLTEDNGLQRIPIDLYEDRLVIYGKNPVIIKFFGDTREVDGWLIVKGYEPITRQQIQIHVGRTKNNEPRIELRFMSLNTTLAYYLTN